MKLPARFDLSNPVSKAYVDRVIKSYGITRSVNEIALSVQCKTETGDRFEILQFHNNRQIAVFSMA